MKNKYLLICLLIILFIINFIPFHVPRAGAADSTAIQEKNPCAQIVRAKRFHDTGDFERAASAWEQAVTLSDPEKETGRYLEIVLHLADAYRSLGYYQKAFAIFDNALPVAEKSSANPGAIFFSSLGDFYLSLGRVDEAIKSLEKALEKARQDENPFVLANVYNNIGNLLAAITDYEGAFAAYEKSLALADSIKETRAPHLHKPMLARLKSKILINIAQVTFWSGDYENTAGTIEQALQEIDIQPDSADKASDIFTITLLISKIRKILTRSPPDSQPYETLTKIALNALKQAKQIGKDMRNSRILSCAYGYMGELYESEKKYQDAEKLTQSALFFAQQGKMPDILYLWQWQMGRLSRARGNIEKAVRAYKNALAELNPIRRAMFRGYRNQKDAFYENVKPVYLGVADLLLKKAETVKDKTIREKILKQARDSIELLKTAELQDFFGDECVTTLQSKNTNPDHISSQTAVIYPVILPDRLVLLLTLPEGIQQIVVPADSRLFEKTVIRFREQLQTRTTNQFIHNAQKLYDWLIRPTEAELAASKTDTLVIVPDGQLRLIPFSTLHDGSAFLVEKYAIATIPSVMLTDPEPFDRENAEILVSGLSESVQDFPPLPGVPGELEAVKRIMGGKVLLQDRDYTLNNLTAEFKNKQYTVMHLATHGLFGGSPDETFLLTYDSRLTMDGLEQLIRSGMFREKKVELLTLSACQTALGDELAGLGLAGVAVKAGVGATLATLWFVDDEATSLAVREFYHQLKTPGMSKAKALQNAQKKLIGQLRYWHPAYWGPFLLIGNWM